MNKLLYRGKDIETMSREELIRCIRHCYQKLEEKHELIQKLNRLNEEPKVDNIYSAFTTTVKEIFKYRER